MKAAGGYPRLQNTGRQKQPVKTNAQNPLSVRFETITDRQGIFLRRPFQACCLASFMP